MTLFSDNWGRSKPHRPLAMTEESRLAETAREAGAQTGTPAQQNPTEVPSRAAQGNEPNCSSSLRRDPGVTTGTNREDYDSHRWRESESQVINLGGTAGRILHPVPKGTG